MFTKDKKRDPKAGKRPDPRQEKRPARQERPAPEDRRKPAAPQQPRRPEDRRRPVASEQPRRPEDRRRPAASQRPVRPEDRRRPAASQQPRRPEDRRRPAAAQKQRRSVQAGDPVHKAARPAPDGEKILYQNAPVSPEKNEDQVYKIDQAPRQTPQTSRTSGTSRPRKQTRPAARKGRQPSVKDEPQGTSYRRSTPKQKKTLKGLIEKQTAKFYKDPEQQAAAARARQASREEKRRKLQKLAARLDTPAIVYTQPKPFNRNRLLIQLISVLAIASALVMGLSVFFKVKYVTVSGAETYSTWAIQEASGIREGDNLLTFGRARACGQITANLPYVESVRIGIKLPDTVNIDVKEIDVAYSIKSGDGEWWLITSEGKVVRQIEGIYAKGYTEVLGVQIDNPVVNELATAMEEVPDATEEGEETKATESKLDAPVTVTGALRLKAALQILQALEANDIVGEAATVNVENLEKIELWYGQRYQVFIGDATNLDYKISCMYAAILQMSDYQNGMLDVSFTKKKDQVVYTPFV